MTERPNRRANAALYKYHSLVISRMYEGSKPNLTQLLRAFFSGDGICNIGFGTAASLIVELYLQLPARPPRQWPVSVMLINTAILSICVLILLLSTRPVLRYLRKEGETGCGKTIIQGSRGPRHGVGSPRTPEFQRYASCR